MATHLYLDHAQEPDPLEMGLYWATRYVNTEKTFGFMPDDIFANADVDRMGHPIDLDELCKNNWCPKTKRPENVIGKMQYVKQTNSHSVSHLPIIRDQYRKSIRGV